MDTLTYYAAQVEKYRRTACYAKALLEDTPSWVLSESQNDAKAYNHDRVKAWLEYALDLPVEYFASMMPNGGNEFYAFLNFYNMYEKDREGMTFMQWMKRPSTVNHEQA